MKPYEKISLSSDKMMEDSTTKSLLVRELSDNKSVWTWSGKEILDVGDANLEFCIRTVYGDPNEECQAFGIIRFEVLGEDRYTKRQTCIDSNNSSCFTCFSSKCI